MKKIIRFVIMGSFLHLAAMSLCQAQETVPKDWREPGLRWEETRSSEGGFRILAPGPMRSKVDTMKTAIGALAYHTFFYQPPDQGHDNQLYLVSYCDYPPHTVHSDSTDLLPEFFQASVEAASFSIDGEVRYADPLQYFHYPGYIWRIDYLNGQAVIKTKVYLVGRRLYTLQVATYRELNLNPLVDKFLDSFRLIEP